MDQQLLSKTAAAMVAKGKGILAADESSGTCEKRFKSVGVESTEENRRAYRGLLFGTPGIEQYLSGVILFDKPFSPMVRLTLPYATSGLIVSKKAVQTLGKAAWLKKPIGTGPYEIVSYTPKRELIMKRFDQYGGATGQHASAFPWEEIRLSLVGSGAAPTGGAARARRARRRPGRRAAARPGSSAARAARGRRGASRSRRRRAGS